MITKLSGITDMAKAKKRRKIAVAAAGDIDVLQALKNADEAGIIEPILVGQKEIIEKICAEIGYDISKYEIIDIEDKFEASLQASQLIREGRAQILMKGLVSTGQLLKAVLDKNQGLRTGSVLSHVAVFESPYYHKLLGITDAAMNVAPTFEEKIHIINNAVKVFHLLGEPNPKVAVVGAVETVNQRMESTMHAATLSMMNKRQQIKGCIIDGPLALDNAISKKAAAVKNIDSEVAGDVDIVVAPDINGANFLYKALNFLGGAKTAAVIMGAKVPIVLTSRADSEQSKFMSISLAAAIG
ncbi:MAG: bifunctional enoyl-CoA hydratase/phosphate acetyltransferase [Bacteroidales bacterium]|nr:bifunctional enoyl-CoA hydratase/phosphate acetyltransferase [Bacteroidales bacterium]MCF8403941.1 bifunctional enoyl-CoA hydratase/phosphate acetyltransferase [Bacteroidales bacterium]